jgi:hypothetical protein
VAFVVFAGVGNGQPSPSVSKTNTQAACRKSAGWSFTLPKKADAPRPWLTPQEPASRAEPTPQTNASRMAESRAQNVFIENQAREHAAPGEEAMAAETARLNVERTESHAGSGVSGGYLLQPTGQCQ